MLNHAPSELKSIDITALVYTNVKSQGCFISILKFNNISIDHLLTCKLFHNWSSIVHD